MNHRLLNALAGLPCDRPPLWLMRQAGRYLPEYRALRAKTPDFMEFCRQPEACCEAALQPLARYPLDATIVFSDILTVVEALGQAVRFEPGKGPILSHQLDSGVVPHLPRNVTGELSYVYQAVATLKDAVRDRVPVIGFSGSPWTLACYMIEGGSSKTFTRARGWAYSCPESLTLLVNHLADEIGWYLSEQVTAGADAVMLFDTWGGLLSPKHFATFSAQAMQRAIQVLRQTHPQIPVLVFTKGGGQWLDTLTGLDCQALGFDWTVDMTNILSQVPTTLGIQGNLDPALLLGDPKTITESAKALKQCLQTRTGTIGNLGHGIDPQTPPENVETLVEAWVSS